MNTVQIKDKCFVPFIKEADILKEVERVANEINKLSDGMTHYYMRQNLPNISGKI